MRSPWHVVLRRVPGGGTMLPFYLEHFTAENIHSDDGTADYDTGDTDHATHVVQVPEAEWRNWLLIGAAARADVQSREGGRRIEAS